MQVAGLLSPAAGRGRAHAAARGVLDALRADGLTPGVLPAAPAPPPTSPSSGR